ncbi:IucA/IucC family C-terminal-domain containing protein [Brevibacillus sp. H7]|uniref:IucA/IucC family C-terminal-domain containing protein n=1 Tax=Brevibacillus sp. H7 TaxID=3349138 RepID=UPI0038198C1C
MYPELNVSALERAFRIHIASEPEAPLRFSAASLLHKEEGKRFLQEVGSHIHSPSYVVTASLFFKRFLALLSGGLYTMSHHSVELNISLPNVTLCAEGSWSLPRFHLREAGGFRPDPADRERWREQVAERMFRDTIKPLISALASYTGIHTNVLWSHTAYIIHYYYDEFMRRAETDELREQIRGDFHFLTKKADPKLFGLRDRNPMNNDFTVIPHPTEADHPIRIRKQCCFQYRLQGGKCCYTCPMLNEEKRLEQILAYGN